MIFLIDSTCHDMDPKDKCAYLKELGLCSEGEKHPEVRRRCQETCGLCGEACIDCGPCKFFLLIFFNWIIRVYDVENHINCHIDFKNSTVSDDFQ